MHEDLSTLGHDLHVMPARSEAGQERTKIRDAPSWFALIPRMDAHILLPRSMRPGSRDRSEQAGPQGAGPGPGHRGAPPAAVLAARWGSVLRSFPVSQSARHGPDVAARGLPAAAAAAGPHEQLPRATSGLAGTSTAGAAKRGAAWARALAFAPPRVSAVRDRSSPRGVPQPPARCRSDGPASPGPAPPWATAGQAWRPRPQARPALRD